MPEKDEVKRNEKGQFQKGTVSYMKYSKKEYKDFFVQYCEHISKGFDKESFQPCSYKTVNAWIKENEEQNTPNFPAIKEALQIAEAKGRSFWEEALYAIGLGRSVQVPDYKTPGGMITINPKDSNATVLIFIIKSKFRETYGDHIKSESNSNNNVYIESDAFRIVNPANGKVEDLEIGAE